MQFHFSKVTLAIFLSLLAARFAVAAPPPVEIYGQLPGFEMAAISGSGERIAVVGVAADARRLMVVDRNNQLLLAVPLGDNKLRDVYWAGEDRLLLETSHTVDLGPNFTAAQAELSSITVVPLNGGAVWNIFDKTREITGGVRGYYGAIEKQGRWYGYFGGITLAGNSRDGLHLGNTSPELYEVDLETGRPSRVARRTNGPETYRRWLLDENGAVAATLDFSSRQGDWQIKTPDNRTIVSGRAPFGDVGLVGLGSTAGTLVYRSSTRKQVIRAGSSSPWRAGRARKSRLASRRDGGSPTGVRAGLSGMSSKATCRWCASTTPSAKRRWKRRGRPFPASASISSTGTTPSTA
jgi:hypothetical protein